MIRICALLVIEDDKDLNRQLVAALETAGYAVDAATDGEEGHFLGDTEPYDAVVLDIGLPKMDGIAVLDRLAQGGADHAGADPDRARRLEREGAGLRRRRRRLCRQAFPSWRRFSPACAPCCAARPGTPATNCCAARWRSTPNPGRVLVAGAPIKLTSHEYRLLAYLMHHSGRVVSRSEIVEHLYDQDFDRDSNTIEVFIGRLRKKLGVDVLQTVRGLGYMMEPGAAQDGARK